MKKWISILLLMIGAIILGACSEIDAKDLSSYPESVQDGDISVKFYEELQHHIENDKTHSAKLEEVLSDIATVSDETIYQTVDDYNSYLNNVHFNPSTDKDSQISEMVTEVIESQIVVNNLFRDFVENKDDDFLREVFLDATIEAIEETKQARGALRSLLKEHSLDF